MVDRRFSISKSRVAALILVLLLGLYCRLSQLDRKIFWVDEVATVIRAVGYTRSEVTAQLADGSLHPPADLLAYQQITPHRTLADTLHALSRSPEHAPLYFLLTRFWMQGFGSAPVAVRSLSVVCSLLALPCIAALCRELQLQGARMPRFGWMAVTLVALSPFFVAYAQEARPYSAWLLTISLTSWALLRAIRLDSKPGWLIYTLTLVLGFYTSLLSLLLALGQAVYCWMVRPGGMARFGLSLGLAVLAFLPWLALLWQQQAVLAANTTWMRTAIHPLSMLAIWLYSFAVLFFDVPVVASGWIAAVQAVIAAFVLVVMGYALYRLSRSDRLTWIFILTLMLPIPLTLMLFDLAMQGQASATPRYLVPSQLGVLLAVAWWLRSPVRSSKILPQQWVGLVLLSLCLLSGWVNLERSPDYQKARNQANPAIAARLNQAFNQIDQPLLVGSSDQTMDLLSLSHSLAPTVRIQILPTDQLATVLNRCQPSYLLAPSAELLEQLRQFGLEITALYKPPLLTREDVHLSLYQVGRPVC